MPKDPVFNPVQDPLLRDLHQQDSYPVLPPCAICGPIGRGGMGVVYRGWHFDLDIDVEVK